MLQAQDVSSCLVAGPGRGVSNEAQAPPSVLGQKACLPQVGLVVEPAEVALAAVTQDGHLQRAEPGIRPNLRPVQCAHTALDNKACLAPATRQCTADSCKADSCCQQLS